MVSLLSVHVTSVRKQYRQASTRPSLINLVDLVIEPLAQGYLHRRHTINCFTETQRENNHRRFLLSKSTQHTFVMSKICNYESFLNRSSNEALQFTKLPKIFLNLFFHSLSCTPVVGMQEGDQIGQTLRQLKPLKATSSKANCFPKLIHSRQTKQPYIIHAPSVQMNPLA